jgi:hypothetical protein
VRLDGIRNRQSCSFASSPSNVSYVKLRKTSRFVSRLMQAMYLDTDFLQRPTCASNHRPLWLSRKPLRLIWCHCLRTPTWLRSMLSVLQSSQRTWHWLVDCGARGHDFDFVHGSTLLVCLLYFFIIYFPEASERYMSREGRSTLWFFRNPSRAMSSPYHYPLCSLCCAVRCCGFFYVSTKALGLRKGLPC